LRIGSSRATDDTEEPQRVTRIRWWTACLLLLAIAGEAIAAAVEAAPASSPERAGSSTPWREILLQPASWYASLEAIRIAENVLLYQNGNGGWEKNLDMSRPLGEAERAALLRPKKEVRTTIDNGASTT
jgi:hypothetical protein